MKNENVVVRTQDWMSEATVSTSYELDSWAQLIPMESEALVEPGQAVNLSPADRARLNFGQAGVRTAPDRL